MTGQGSGTRQIALPLDWGDDNGLLVLTPDMEKALGPLLNVEGWRKTGAILVGPPRSGKSSLAYWLAEKANVDVVEVADRLNDEALFHRWNSAREEGRPILIVSRHPPGEWGISLPDLKSRIAGAMLAEMPHPDEMLMAELMRRHLARRGAMISEDVLAYALKRIERSHAEAERFARKLDEMSLASKKPISLSLVRAALSASSVGEQLRLSDGL